MEKANTNGFDPSVRAHLASHCAYSQQKDVTCCWVASENMQFIPHLQEICIPHSDKQNCLEAHGCTSKHLSKIAPIIGYSLDIFGQNQKLCTCSPQLAKLNLSNEQAAIFLGAQPFCAASSSANISLPCNLATEGHYSTKHENPIRRETKISEPLLSEKLNADRPIQSFDINSNVVKGKPSNSIDNDTTGKLRVRGKRLLCPANATPLYGKTPSWWGDTPLDSQPKSPPAKPDKRNNTTNNRSINHSSKVSKKTSSYKEPSASQANDISNGEERRQSTAFVVSLEKSQQSSQISLSSSLPSFQIGDHLCSYFPMSRKMSFQKRRNSIRRRESMETSEKITNSDAASEHGTYIVDLDIDDDIVVQNKIVPDTPSEKNLKSTKDNGKYSSSTSKNSDFWRTTDVNKLVIRKDEKLKPERVTTRSPRKVIRKKTFVLSPDDLKDHLTDTDQDKVKDLTNNLADITLKVVDVSNDNTNFNTSTLNKLSTLESSLDTIQLSKDSSWNFNKSESFMENMDFEMSVIKLESPKLLNNPNCVKKSKNNETKVYSQSQIINSTVPFYDFNIQKESTEDDTNVFQDHKVIDLETNSNLLTTRSLQTEVLLKPTEEISLHLKKFKNHSKVQDKNKDKSSLLINDEQLAHGSVGFIESLRNSESIESQSIKESFSIYKLDTSSNTDTDTNLTDFPLMDNKKGIHLKERRGSDLSNCTDSTIEANQSDFTDLSLGLKIVQKSRSISSASSEISRESFVPPRRKHAMSLHRLTPSNTCRPLTKSSSSKQKKVSDVPSKELKLNTERGLVKVRSSAELSVRGNSFRNQTNKRELDWTPNCKSIQNNNKFKSEQEHDDLLYLTGIMKYSAQIQLLSGNLLELISLRNRHARLSKENETAETTVTSRLSTTLSTMKASNDLLFDIHDFLADRLDEL